MNNDLSGLETAEKRIVSEIKRLLARKSLILVALDGRSGTGKSTLATSIARQVGGVVIVGDDFYAGGKDEDWAGLSAKQRQTRSLTGGACALKS